MFMNTSTLNNKKDPFVQLSSEWWNVNGKFQSLHKFTDIRIRYINREVSKYKKIDKIYSLNKLNNNCLGDVIPRRISASTIFIGILLKYGQFTT